MTLTADFHNHSCLSPCGSLELSPKALVDLALVRGIGVLALTDHNTARNTPAFEALALEAGLVPLCGVEVTTQEELHCLCLFASAAEATAFGASIEDRLVKVTNKPEKWGDQVVVDAAENVVDEVPFWLGTATDLPLTELGQWCLSAEGLFIPAHIDRPSQSILSQLGYLPDLSYSALEVRGGPLPFSTGHHPLVRGSDAHYPDDVGSRTCHLELEAPTFGAVRQALLSRAVWVE